MNILLENYEMALMCLSWPVVGLAAVLIGCRLVDDQFDANILYLGLVGGHLLLIILPILALDVFLEHHGGLIRLFNKELF